MCRIYGGANDHLSQMQEFALTILQHPLRRSAMHQNDSHHWCENWLSFLQPIVALFEDALMLSKLWPN
jgi:hypothetical protein